MLLRYAFRNLTRDRAFSVIAILTLALGIGANTAIFSLINGVLLKPLPYPDADRLVTIEEQVPKVAAQFPSFPVNGRHFLEWRKQSRAFDQFAAIDSRRLTLTGAGEPEQIATAMVSANLFSMLGVQPALGRGFVESEDRPGHQQVVVITDSLWRRRFSADPALIGKSINLGGEPHSVVGILPPQFRFFSNHQLSPISPLEPSTDVFRPIAINIEHIGPMGEFNYIVIGKMKPGVSREQALAELNVMQAGIASQLKGEDKAELRAVVTPLEQQITGQSRAGLLVLLAAVGAILLIVCVNLANLMLARALAHQRDAAIRLALGASRGALFREILTGSFLLSAIGGALGMAVAWWGVRVLIAAAPGSIPRLEEVALDGRVLVFSLAVTVVAGLLFGILPALRLARSEPADALRSGGRGSTENTRGVQMRSVLVSAEVALSTVLLIAAGLLLHSFVRLMKIDKGFETESTLAADIMLPGNRYGTDEARGQFYNRLLDKTRSLPGVRDAGLVSVLPLEGEGWGDMISVEGERRPMEERPLANYRFVSPGYFTAIGIPLLQGRFIEETDRKAMPAVISQTTAARIYPGQNPIGKQFHRATQSERAFEIVGVVGDIHVSSLQKAPTLQVYVPYWFRSRTNFSLAVRTSMDPTGAASALRAVVRELDSEVPISKVRTMQQVVSDSVSQRRFQMALVLLFAVTALILASLGVYGVVSYMVTQRRNEMGIRIALGATAGNIHRLILSQGLAPVIGGLVLGLAAALALGRVLASLLFEVGAQDPITFA
ncbi:MAG: ABC transporter permease, partial [Bryobacteraceae bacterium]